LVQLLAPISGIIAKKVVEKAAALAAAAVYREMLLAD